MAIKPVTKCVRCHKRQHPYITSRLSAVVFLVEFWFTVTQIIFKGKYATSYIEPHYLYGYMQL